MQLVVLRSFTSFPEELDILFSLSSLEWKRLLYWLDISGLALYFLVRLRDLGLDRRLPLEILERLQQNLVDNTKRMAVMAAEAVALQKSFQSRGLEYALLKGFSLWPHSVPAFEHRSQLDLDFLIAPADLKSADAIMIRHGYRLHAQSGRSWEYKDEPVPRTSLRQLYQDTGSRCAELHVASAQAHQAQLQGCEFIFFQGVSTPVLAADKVFMGQALHLYKHLAGEGARAAHGVELYRHIMYRHDDEAFWRRLRNLAEEDAHTRFALGFVVALLTHTLGSFAPGALTSWTSERLPQFAHRWIDRFGLGAALGSSLGSKLSMILQDELRAHGLESSDVKRQRLIPIRLPPKIEHPAPRETFVQCAGRNTRQSLYILHRLRFHVVEGIRLSFERVRWKRVGTPLQHSDDNSFTHV